MSLWKRLNGVLGVAAAGSLAAAAGAAQPLGDAPFAVQPVAADEAVQPALRAADVAAALNLINPTIVELNFDTAIGRPVLVPVPVEGREIVLDLAPFSVRAPGFTLREQLADGSWRDVDPGPVDTLRGEILGMPGSAAAGGMMADGLYCTFILPDGSQWWLEPLNGRVAGAGKNSYALYRNGEAVVRGVCGTTEEDRIHAPDHPVEGGFSPRGATRYTAQVATDADFEFYSRYGGTSQVNSRISLVINTMNLQYERDVDIRHVISGTRVRTAEPDPYSSTDSVTLLNQMRTHWNANEQSVIRDTAHLFTGKQIDGNTIGRAFIGVICSSVSNGSGYGFSQLDYNNNFMSATDLVAHELGHNWNACHCACTSPQLTMNPNITSINRFRTNTAPPNSECGSTNITEIVNHRNSRNCLTTDNFGLGPPNDACASAILIDTGTFGFNNLSATNDGPTACGAFGADIWYTYVPDCDGTLTVTTCNSTYDTTLAAYTGGCASLTEVACNDDDAFCGGDPPRQSRISFPVVRGTTYRIRVGGFSGLTGYGTLNVTQAACPAPSNNNCSNATLVTQGVDIPFSTIGATTDGPLEPGACTFFGYAQVGNDIWFRYVAPCGGPTRVSTCGSNFDTKIAVYTVCPSGAAAIACNDDDGPACSGTRASVDFAATAGTTYRIRVGGYSNGVGTGTLRITSLNCPPPPNDACANAIDVSAGGTFNGTLIGATNDGTASCGASGDQPDVWYRFTAPGAGACPGGAQLVVTTCGTHDGPGPNLGMDTVLALFSACGGAELMCNDDTNRCGDLDQGTLRDSRVTASLTPGQTVLIRVSRFSTVTAGPFTLRVAYAAANNDCQDASVIGLGTHPFCTLGATTDGPVEPGLCNQNNDVWFRFTATCNAPVRVSTCGANYDSEIAIYPGPGCPAAPGTVIACNDDSCGLQSNVTFPAATGSSYLIRVGGFSTGSRGSGNLAVRIAADWNGDGNINSSDISAYITSWLDSVNNFNRNADFNNDNVVNSTDISAFITAWLAAINGGC